VWGGRQQQCCYYSCGGMLSSYNNAVPFFVEGVFCGKIMVGNIIIVDWNGEALMLQGVLWVLR
jgi:hypothetical protein